MNVIGKFRIWLIPFLLIAVGTIGFTAGQGSEGDAAGPGADPDEFVTWDVQTTGMLQELVDQTVQRYNEENPEEPLEVVHVQNDPYKDKLQVAMGADSPPDIFHTWGGGVLKQYVDAGKVDVMTDLTDGLMETHVPVSFDAVTFDGETYARPYSGLTGVHFFYRTDIFEEHGLEPPETWDDFIEVGETLQENDITPIALANRTRWTGSFYYMYLADRAGGSDMFADAFAGTGSFTDDGFIEAGERIQELVERDFFPQGFNGMEYDTGESRNMFYNGDAAMMLMGSWLYEDAQAEAPEAAENFGMFRFPTLPDGEGEATNLIGSAGQNYFAISEQSENKEAARTFLRDYVMSDEYVTFMADNGLVPPVREASTYVDDPLLQEAARQFEEADSVQLYYDQYLPPELADTHLDVVQSLFGLNMEPEEAARRHQEAFDEYQAELEE